MSETKDVNMEELQSICCYSCGAINIQLYINHEINDYAYKQIACLPCAAKWQENGGSW
jgi:hypothetical protein